MKMVQFKDEWSDNDWRELIKERFADAYAPEDAVYEELAEDTHTPKSRPDPSS